MSNFTNRWPSTAISGAFLALCSLPMVLILRMVYDAAIFPMELEIREGVSWLHVLTQAKGISIFDHNQVAYYCMHGPFDHLVKTVFHILIPVLPSQTVVRLAVAALPIFLLYFAYECTANVPRWRLHVVVLSAAIIYAGMANLRSYNLLVGRPDPMAVLFLALQGGITARIFHQKNVNRSLVAFSALAMSMALFTVWRIFPTAGALWLVAGLSAAQGRLKEFVKYCVLTGSVVIGVFGLLVFVVFSGQPSLYYDHFVKFFAGYLKIGTAGPWQVFADELLVDGTIRLAILPQLAASLMAPLFFDFKKDRVVIVAFGLSAVSYLAYSYGYHQNKSGAGLQYFSPFVLFAWMPILVAFNKFQLKLGPRRAVVGLAATAFVLPSWSQIRGQYQSLESAQNPVSQFRAQLEAWDTSGQIMSETYHLYKRDASATLVDNGDGAEELISTLLLGPEFANTAARFFSNVQSGKYQFFLTGGIESQRTTDFLKSNYQVLGSGPPYDQMNAQGGCHSPINCPLLWKHK